MQRAVFLIMICILLSAGCLISGPTQAEEIQVITPGEGLSLYDNQMIYTTIIGQTTPDIKANYSMGEVVIQAGNATPLHRLTGSTEFVYLISGEAGIQCDNSTTTLRKGQAALLPEGVLQSIKAVGDSELRYINAIQPPYSAAVEISGDELTGLMTDGVPIVIPDPENSTTWGDYESANIYTMLNPALMAELKTPISYSVAYARLLPGGSVRANSLNGASEVIYVISGEIEVFTPDGDAIRVPAGSAVYIPPDHVKGYRNVGESGSEVLSVVDPAWTPERTVMAE